MDDVAGAIELTVRNPNKTDPIAARTVNKMTQFNVVKGKAQS